MNSRFLLLAISIAFVGGITLNTADSPNSKAIDVVDSMNSHTAMMEGHAASSSSRQHVLTEGHSSSVKSHHHKDRTHPIHTQVINSATRTLKSVDTLDFVRDLDNDIQEEQMDNIQEQEGTDEDLFDDEYDTDENEDIIGGHKLEHKLTHNDTHSETKGGVVEHKSSGHMSSRHSEAKASSSIEYYDEHGIEEDEHLIEVDEHSLEEAEKLAEKDEHSAEADEKKTEEDEHRAEADENKAEEDEHSAEADEKKAEAETLVKEKEDIVVKNDESQMMSDNKKLQKDVEEYLAHNHIAKLKASAKESTAANKSTVVKASTAANKSTVVKASKSSSKSSSGKDIFSKIFSIRRLLSIDINSKAENEELIGNKEEDSEDVVRPSSSRKLLGRSRREVRRAVSRPVNAVRRTLYRSHGRSPAPSKQRALSPHVEQRVARLQERHNRVNQHNFKNNQVKKTKLATIEKRIDLLKNGGNKENKPFNVAIHQRSMVRLANRIKNIKSKKYDNPHVKAHKIRRLRNDLTKMKRRLNTQHLSAAAAAIVSNNENKLNKWLTTKEGIHANEFCKTLGIKNNFDVFNGCLFDIMTTKDRDVAKESVLAAEEFRARARETPSKKFCVASGDPHFTNYDGDFFHLQEPGIFTIAKTLDGIFEVQEKMRKNGSNRPGVPACMSGVVVHYKKMNVEVDVSRFSKVKVNGIEMDLPKDYTLTLGGVKIRYGKQIVEWRGSKVVKNGLKVTVANGFSAMIMGGYCGVLEVNAPARFFGGMRGICGNADGKRDVNDYRGPSNKVMDVRRGKKRWEMSGYGGPTSPLSKWQLAWKATGDYCYFGKDCEAGPKRPVIVTPSSSPIPSPTPVIITSSSLTSRSERSSGSKRKINTSISERIINNAVAELTDSKFGISSHLTKLKEIFSRLTIETKAEQARFEEENRKSYIDADTSLTKVTERFNSMNKHLMSLQQQMTTMNISIHRHYSKMIADTDYLRRLDSIKPGFLRSLDEVGSKVGAMKVLIKSNMIPDEYRVQITRSLHKLMRHSVNITGFIAQAFINHYNKYRNLIGSDSTIYQSEMSSLEKVAEQYRIEKMQITEVSKEYTNMMELVRKLKSSYESSRTQSNEFTQLISIIDDILSKRNKCSPPKAPLAAPAA